MLSRSILAVTLASAAYAQTNSTAYATGLLGALAANNLTTLAAVATANAATLLPLLQAGNHTIFAPTNAAFAAVPNATLSNATLVAQIVSYHLLNGAFYPTANTSAGHSVFRTALSAPGLVNLRKYSVLALLSIEVGRRNDPGGQKADVVARFDPFSPTSLAGGGPQVVVVQGAGNAVTVVQASGNVTSVGMAVYENLVIYVVPTVLTVPVSVTATASAIPDVSALVTALTGAAAAFTGTLDTTAGVTIFAPYNAAFAAAASLLGTVNASTIATVLMNHVVNGTVVYSPNIVNGATLTSTSGQPLRFITNATGAYVQSAAVTAKILIADVLTKNGVIHVIDQILLNTASNTTAANSAQSSAAVAGTAAATATGSIGGAGGNATATGAAKAGAANVVVGGLFGLVGAAALLI